MQAIQKRTLVNEKKYIFEIILRKQSKHFKFVFLLFTFVEFNLKVSLPK